MSKPTPGPWSADPNMSIGAVVAHVDRLFGQPIVVRATTCNMDMNMTTAEMDAEAQANATLIAATPELAEALADLVYAVNEGHNPKRALEAAYAAQEKAGLI